MKLDWATDTFKGLIVAGITWTVIYLRKKVKPTLKLFLKFTKLVENTEDQQKKIVLIDSKQNAMMDISRDPYFMTNAKGEVTYVNSAFVKMVGASDPKDCHGFGYLEYIPREDKKMILEMSDLYVAHPSAYDGEVRYINKLSKSTITTECKTSMLFDSEGKYNGSIGRLYIIKIEDTKQTL